MIYTFDADWRKPPLTLNMSLNRWRKAELVHQIRWAGAWWGHALRLQRQAHVTVRMFYFVTDSRRRDTDNLVATLKPFCDGLVDAMIVPDDTPQYMAKPSPAICYKPDVEPGIRFILETEE